MSLSQQIVDALDKLPADLATPRELHASSGPHRLTLFLRLASAIGVEVEALEFSIATPEPADRSTESLRAWADRVANRVTYLMEPLVLLELDDEGGVAELRSQTPTARDGRRAFYEVRLNRQGTLRLRRLAFDEEDRRRQETPFQLSREVLERLADDLVATAD